MDRAISLVINARVGSTRLVNKMLRPFAGSSLLKIALDKLASFAHPNKFLAAGDQEIIDLYHTYDPKSFGLLRRHPESVSPCKVAHDHKITFAHYEHVPTPYIMSVNACCPFLSVDTIRSAMDIFVATGSIKTLTSVKRICNIFFDDSGQVLNNNGLAVLSNANHPIFEMAHAFHIFDKDFFLKNGHFWSYETHDPELFEIRKQEALDVDDQLDFTMCEQLYKGLPC